MTAAAWRNLLPSGTQDEPGADHWAGPRADSRVLWGRDGWAVLIVYPHPVDGVWVWVRHHMMAGGLSVADLGPVASAVALAVLADPSNWPALIDLMLDGHSGGHVRAALASVA